MSNSTFGLTASEASTNSTALYFGPEEMLDILNVVFGFPMYSWVLWLIVTGKGSGVSSEFFMLNLLVCEIGTCMNSLLTTLELWVWLPSLILQILTGLGLTGRALFQCLMCVERYLAVVHPVTFLKYKPLRYRVVCCMAAWIITLGCCLCLIFFLNIVLVCLFLLQFLLFLFIQLFCLVAVLRALKKSGPVERVRKKKEEDHIKQKAFYLILITTVNMAVIYVPFTTSLFFCTLPQEQLENFSTFGLYCYIFAGFVQPVLYLKRAGKLSCLCFKRKI